MRRTCKSNVTQGREYPSTFQHDCHHLRSLAFPFRATKIGFVSTCSMATGDTVWRCLMCPIKFCQNTETFEFGLGIVSMSALRLLYSSQESSGLVQALVPGFSKGESIFWTRTQRKYLSALHWMPQNTQDKIFLRQTQGPVSFTCNAPLSTSR